jgi:hypothetical protein
MQLYVIKFVNDWRQVGGFSGLSMTGGRSVVSLVSSTNKPDRHDTTEILLKVAFKSTTLTINTNCRHTLEQSRWNKLMLHAVYKH